MQECRNFDYFQIIEAFLLGDPQSTVPYPVDMLEVVCNHQSPRSLSE
jgi:hypothetical protein